jgi:hypothetical protein
MRSRPAHSQADTAGDRSLQKRRFAQPLNGVGTWGSLDCELAPVTLPEDVETVVEDLSGDLQ